MFALAPLGHQHLHCVFMCYHLQRGLAAQGKLNAALAEESSTLAEHANTQAATIEQLRKKARAQDSCIDYKNILFISTMCNSSVSLELWQYLNPPIYRHLHANKCAFTSYRCDEVGRWSCGTVPVTHALLLCHRRAHTCLSMRYKI